MARNLAESSMKYLMSPLKFWLELKKISKIFFGEISNVGFKFWTVSIEILARYPMIALSFGEISNDSIEILARYPMLALNVGEISNVSIDILARYPMLALNFGEISNVRFKFWRDIQCRHQVTTKFWRADLISTSQRNVISFPRYADISPKGGGLPRMILESWYGISSPSVIVKFEGLGSDSEFDIPNIWAQENFFNLALESWYGISSPKKWAYLTCILESCLLSEVYHLKILNASLSIGNTLH